MIKVENISVYNFDGAIHGMRNPMNSWEKSDSYFGKTSFVVGKADMELMQKLYKAGTEHRKYARQIFASMDITAPRYWWTEFDTYKIGVASNSCSTMHKIHAKEFTRNDFSVEHLDDESLEDIDYIIKRLNANRNAYNVAKDKHYWWQMIQLLPQSYNQRRTVTMTYENVFSMIRQREKHKLDEWREFVEILKGLPYVAEITRKD